jgi:hypothetical protein
MTKCFNCGKDAEEVCPDGACKPCHVSVTWEDCLTKTFNARKALAEGHPRDLVKQMFPEADWNRLS